MKRYYYNSYEAAIPDGRIKARAIAQATWGSEGLYWQSIA